MAFKRRCVHGDRTQAEGRRTLNAELKRADAAVSSRRLDAWFTDCRAITLHSALGFKSPLQYRAPLGSVSDPKRVS